MNERVYVIAEAGVNHNGSLDQARALIDAAKVTGADAVKFQTFRTDDLVTLSAPKAEYQNASTGEGSQHEMLVDLELSFEDHLKLRGYAESIGIEFLSTGFDLESLQFLVEGVGIGRVKIPSGELTNLPLLLAAGATHKPLIVSTGMADLNEIEMALRALALGSEAARSRSGDVENIYQIYRSDWVAERWIAEGIEFDAIRDRTTLLHCTTQYPAPLESVNLLAMTTMANTFDLPIGYSDHTLGIAVSIGAVTLGAAVIEKHITLDRSLAGPDHSASLEPEEFASMVQGIRDVSAALGSDHKTPSEAEIDTKSVARRSLVAGKYIRAGAVLDHDNLAIKRPGDGVNPMEYYEVLGTHVEVELLKDDLIPQRD